MFGSISKHAYDNLNDFDTLRFRVQNYSDHVCMQHPITCVEHTEHSTFTPMPLQASKQNRARLLSIGACMLVKRPTSIKNKFKTKKTKKKKKNKNKNF